MNYSDESDQPAAGQARQVLVVDDDDGIREAITFMLEDAGYTVLQESDGERALARVRASVEPLVVLLDLRLGCSDGSQVLHEALAQPELATRHAFVLMTGAAKLPEGLPTVLRQLGAVIVAKPFEVDYMLAVVERAALQLPR